MKSSQLLLICLLAILLSLFLQILFLHRLSCNDSTDSRASIPIGDVPQKPTPDLTVFYNVFVPDNTSKMFFRSVPASLSYVKSIIEEQLSQRQNSIVPNGTLYYMTAGKQLKGILNCTNCFFIEHHPIGNEFKTLSKLWEFCLTHKHKRVAYLHNKGSYHPGHLNDYYRRMLTKSVFSSQCVRMEGCNTCSARFSPLPHFHTPGNMWVADCSYVSKLLNPISFGLDMDRTIDTADEEMFGDVYKMGAAEVARGRYAAEHWVHSHPGNIPCDVYPGRYVWGYDHLPLSDHWTPQRMRAPRFPFLEDYADEGILKRLEGSKEGRWFALEGRMHEWRSLYGVLPGERSWVWGYYDRSLLFGGNLSEVDR